MATIKLETLIEASPEVCFDLSRNIELHKLSTAKTNEEAVEGVTTGLIGWGEYVTWEATHFYVRQRFTSKITAFDASHYFRDEMIKGAFKLFIHDHYFEKTGGKTLMTDVLYFEAPFGIIGRIVASLILKPYLIKFLKERNLLIKITAEQKNTIKNEQPHP